MRNALLMLGLMTCGCSPALPGPEQVAPGECLPAASGQTQACVPLADFQRCRPTEAAEVQDLCDLATVRPELVSSVSCREGHQWRLAFPSAPETCSYANGKLVGATRDQSNLQAIAGYWALHDCVAAALCPERDAGSCVPRSNADRPCDEDVSHFAFCKPTEAEQRAVLCAPDAGSYARIARACDGGVELHDIHSGLGPTDSCVYADGGLIGASTETDTRTGPVHGQWALEGCTQTTLCP